jgi:hypothetical protein
VDQCRPNAVGINKKLNDGKAYIIRTQMRKTVLNTPRWSWTDGGITSIICIHERNSGPFPNTEYLKEYKQLTDTSKVSKQNTLVRITGKYNV